MKRRILVLVLALVMTFGAVVTASANVIDPALVPEKTGKITFILYGDKTPRMEELCNNEFKEVFLKEINCEVDVQFIPWSEYGSGKMTDLMIVSGESFDMTLTDRGWLDSSVGKKYVMDVKDLFDAYMPHYKAVTNLDGLVEFTYPDGGIYAIPIGNKPTADAFRSICVRQDLLEEVGMTKVESIDELNQFVYAVHEKHPDMYATMDYLTSPYILRGFGERNLNELTTGIWIDEDTGEVVSIIDTPEFEEYCKLYQKWYEDGLLAKDILTTSTSNNVLFESGNYMFWRGTCGTTVYENLPNLQKVIPTANTAEYFLKPEKPHYKKGYYNTAFQIPATSENAQYVALLIDLMSTKEYVNLFAYGVEGVDYVIENGRISRICTEELFYDWMMLNVNISVLPNTIPEDFIDTYLSWDDGALPSKVLSVTIDNSEIKTISAQINAVWNEYAYAMCAGVRPYDENIETFRTKLKEAGWEQYFSTISEQVAQQLSK